MSADVLSKAKKLVEGTVVGHLATTEGGQPRVRPIAMKWVGERELWFATHAASRKVDQIKADTAVEVCFMDSAWNHVRVSGTASTTKDDADRQKLFVLIPDLEKHFEGPTDPKYILVKITIERIEYMGIGSIEYETHAVS
ncbi:MAG: pyridoxamine 5'-phosphate oxidase family protein [Verrucomicrobia bacterium]|nr:pyridoxamine 5'-phosphate oxidase family protein [Verrucomicrobiota bacterium]